MAVSGSKYENLSQISETGRVQTQQYARFFETHVQPGVMDGLLQSVPAQQLIDFAGGKAPLPAGITFSDNARAAFAAHAQVIAIFAQTVGAKDLTFTQDGTWYIPPKMREMCPEYKAYLAADYQGGLTVGTAALVLAQNEPVPVYENGKQIGGFETGDNHGFLVITDRRNGRVYEAQQTFMENSDDPALRPPIAQINPAFVTEWAAKNHLSDAEALKQVHQLVKDPNLKLDDVGMLSGKQTKAALYTCEITPNVTEAFNWDGGVPGSNFNYVPLSVTEIGLNAQRLNVLLVDREVAARESSIKAAPGSTGKQNEEGYIPAQRESFYPDGTPRFVTVIEQKGETVFKNAYEGMPGGMPPGTIRVMEYDTVVQPTDMQVVTPYNNLGGSKGCEAASNCYKAACDMLDGVAVGGVNSSIRPIINAKNVHDSGLRNMAIRNAIGGEMTTMNLTGPVDGNVTIHKHSKNGVTFNVYDFIDPVRTGALTVLNLGAITFPPDTIPGKAIAQITAQREYGEANAERVKDPTLFPDGTIGSMIKQAHNVLYGPLAENRAGVVANLHLRHG